MTDAATTDASLACGPPTGTARFHVRVEGIVQGVGFRPFVHTLAGRLDLAGHVGNDVHGVFIEVEGHPSRIDAFLAALRTDAPPLATVDRVTTAPLALAGGGGFRIVASRAGGERTTGVTADSGTCADCVRELFDPADRRFGYAFINCVNCGPRYTITLDVPYDRPRTTMAGFTMCPACDAEYHDPADRRFHAQPTCCPACGPSLRLVDADGTIVGGDPVAGTAALIRRGAVVAVKGLGGYHLAALAASEDATAALRARKHREDKPFAVMVADLDEARSIGTVDEATAALMASPRRPIVLVSRRPGIAAWARVAGPVAPGNRQIGLMLPYTPLHHLLLAAVGEPIVLTSGNSSDEPIAYADDDARERLAGIADAYLTHDRPIHERADDSVARVFRGRPMLLRRARGYAPEPLRLHRAAPRPVLACGAELKNTFCLLKGDRAVMSTHIGDLENYPTLRSYRHGIAHLSRLFDVAPEVIAYDPHPEYLSTKYALERAEAEDLEAVAVQHHHAHIASCLADNGEDGPVIGVAFDGTGYGTDGTLWGGEFLIADLTGFTRAGHLEPVPLPGGAAAIRQPWRMAVSYLAAAWPDPAARGPDEPGTRPVDPQALGTGLFAAAARWPGPQVAGLLARHEDTWRTVVAMAAAGVNSPLTSSAGRLFDAAAALCGVRDAINYEGQAAIELEQRTDPHEKGAYPATVTDGDPITIAGTDLIRALADDLRAGTPVAAASARFHHGLADAAVRVCVMIRARTGISVAALSGGVFQNLLLLSRTAERLEANGFRVLTHSRVPANDGGISLGQAAVAAVRSPQN